jgi:hypothetical protein
MINCDRNMLWYKNVTVIHEKTYIYIVCKKLVNIVLFAELLCWRWINNIHLYELLCHLCYMPCPCHLPPSDRSNNTRRGVQIILASPSRSTEGVRRIDNSRGQSGVQSECWTASLLWITRSLAPPQSVVFQAFTPLNLGSSNTPTPRIPHTRSGRIYGLSETLRPFARHGLLLTEAALVRYMLRVLRSQSSRIARRVVWYICTNVSGESTASIFKAETYCIQRHLHRGSLWHLRLSS